MARSEATDQAAHAGRASASGEGGVRAWSPFRGYAVYLIPPAAMLAVFFVLPLLYLMFRSFAEPEPGIGTYVRLFSNVAYLKVLLYTVQVSASVTVVTLVMAYPVAWLISRAHGRMLHLALAFVIIPFWTSAVIRTYAWIVLFQRRGVLNDFLISAGLTDEPLRLMYNSLGVHIGMVHIMLPFMILPLFSSMRSIDGTYMRAASVLGANPLRQFVHVYLPLSMPGVTAGCLLVFITSLGFFITPALLGGPQNMMIAVLIEQQATRLLDWPMASALATVLLVVTGVLYLIYDRVSRRVGGGGVGGL